MVDERSSGPRAMDWTWDTSREFDGVAHRARWVSGLARAESRVLIVEGLPAPYVEELLAAAQVADTSPAWQVPADAGPFAASRIERARQRLEYDLKVYAARFITAFAESAGGALAPLGCASVRSRITPEFESRYWTVAGRVLVVPEQRGRGLASALSLPFLQASQSLFAGPRLGFVMETVSASVRRLLAHAVEGGMLNAVCIEPRRHRQTADDSFLGFYPGARDGVLALGRAALARGDLQPAVEDLVGRVHEIWLSGGSTQTCTRVARDFARGESGLLAAAAAEPGLAVHLDFLLMLRAWGVLRTEQAIDTTDG